jgi:uncharacterized membrane protein
VKRSRLVEWWVNRGAFVLAIAFVAAFFWLTARQYGSFRTRAPDVAMFDQAVWNTLHGRFLFSSIKNNSILAFHFSPLMALLSPLLLIWSDVRILFLAQTVGLAVTGLFLYQIVRLKHPTVAPWFLAAFYLNPALHEVALHEFRRVTLAAPFLALALYALYVRKRWLMVWGLVLALLLKEDIGLIVLMVGIYLLIFEREWRWGLPLAVGGGIWLIAMLLWVIPAFGTSDYAQLGYFARWGDSFGDIAVDMLRDPLTLLQTMFDQSGLQALWRIFLPLGLVLPFLAADWLLIGLPTIAYMLMSNWPPMHQLGDWYMAPVLPVLFAAVAVGLTRVSSRRARWLTLGMLGTVMVGYRLFSFAPLGGKYNPLFFELTAHHRLASEVVATVPPDARVAAQDAFVPHLAHREHIYRYPWIAIGRDNIDYFVFDRHLNAYPFQAAEIGYEIDNLVADTSFVVEMEGDGIYLLRNDGEPLPSFSVQRVAEGSMKLDRVELAVLGERGFFHTVGQQPVELKPGQEVRVTLYWEALKPPDAERTVSVRLADASGVVLAQYDGMPGKGNKPTSWWQTGWKIRDVYYLTIPAQAQPALGSLDVLLYDTYSLDIVPFDRGTDILHVSSVTVTR